MAAATTFVPIEVYLRSSFEPDAEYVDGVIEDRPAGENDHSAWQGAISAWFRQQAREGEIRVRPELRVQVLPTHIRVPDVTLLDRSLPQEPIATHPPIAVFEVLSPEDTLRKVITRCGNMSGWGFKPSSYSIPMDQRGMLFVIGTGTWNHSICGLSMCREAGPGSI